VTSTCHTSYDRSLKKDGSPEWSMIQAVVSTKHKALSSNISTAKNNKNKIYTCIRAYINGTGQYKCNIKFMRMEKKLQH
jgi:hypothetical protein